MSVCSNISNIHPISRESSICDIKDTIYWDDLHNVSNMSIGYGLYDIQLFSKLLHNPIFIKKCTDFCENILCLTSVNIEQGLRLLYVDGFRNRSGFHKKYLLFLLAYRQNGITYNIAYECDVYDDPNTGWFTQWFHSEHCNGYECDTYHCHCNYTAPKKYYEKLPYVQYNTRRVLVRRINDAA